MLIAVALSFRFAIGQILLAFTSKQNVDWSMIPQVAKMYYYFFTTRSINDFVPKKRWDRFLDGVDECLARTNALREIMMGATDAESGEISSSQLSTDKKESQGTD